MTTNDSLLRPPTGSRIAREGIREFVVGTGGGGLYAFKQLRPNSEVRNNRSYGIIKLTLRPADYSWEYLSAAGEPFQDSGTRTVHVNKESKSVPGPAYRHLDGRRASLVP